MIKCLTISFFLLYILILTEVYAQIDSLVVKNNRYLIGEIKSMERGVLTIKTEYSKTDFKVEWNEIRAIYSESLFITSAKTQNRIYDKISSPEMGILKITTLQGNEFTFPSDEILYI